MKTSFDPGLADHGGRADMSPQRDLAAVSRATPVARRSFDADDPAEIAGLVRRAARRDSRAWVELVVRFNPRVRAAARDFGLSAADVDDVVQTAWLAALTYIHRIEKPEAIARQGPAVARGPYSLRVLLTASVLDEPFDPERVADAAPSRFDLPVDARGDDHARDPARTH